MYIYIYILYIYLYIYIYIYSFIYIYDKNLGVIDETSQPLQAEIRPYRNEITASQENIEMRPLLALCSFDKSF